jgi:hypothetical protein
VKWVSLRSKIYVTGLIMGTLAWTASLTPVLSFLSLSLSRLSSLFALLWQYSGTAMAFSPFHSFPFFFLALHTVSLGMHSRGTFPFGITVEGGKKESADDFERLYERKRTQMKQREGWRGGLRAPLLLSLSQTHLLFFFPSVTRPGPVFLPPSRSSPLSTQ